VFSVRLKEDVEESVLEIQFCEKLVPDGRSDDVTYEWGVVSDWITYFVEWSVIHDYPRWAAIWFGDQHGATGIDCQRWLDVSIG